MKNQNMTTKLAVLSAVVVLSVVSASANPITFTVDPHLPPTTTAYVLGAVNPGAPANDASDVTYVNGILGLSLGGSGTAGSDSIYRSLNVFSGLPTSASVDNASGADGAAGQTSITLLAGVDFLVAKYDGQNGGSEVWYVGGLAAGTVIDIPAFGFGTRNDQFGLSGTVQLLGSGTQSVPDGGSTLVLLGIAGLGLFAFVRKTQTA